MRYNKVYFHKEIKRRLLSVIPLSSLYYLKVKAVPVHVIKAFGRVAI